MRGFGGAVLKDLLSNTPNSSKSLPDRANTPRVIRVGLWVMNRLEVRNLQQSKELVPGVTRPL